MSVNNVRNASLLSSIYGKHIVCNRNKSTTSSEYCLNLVKAYDYENFACTLLLKNTARSSALAIRGFNTEIARIAEQVSQQNTAVMRFQFWEEALEKCLMNNFEMVPKHPVAMELFKANGQTKFSKRYFNNIVKSRKDYYNVRSFTSLDEMEAYAEKSVSNVLYLILEGSGVKSIHADHAASHLGKAQGLVQQVRSIPHARKINFIPVPQDILIKNNLSEEEILRAKTSERLKDCSNEIAVRAYQHLSKARSLYEKIPKNVCSVLLPAVPVSIYLDNLEKVNFDVFHPSLKIRPWRLLPYLWLHNFKNKY